MKTIRIIALYSTQQREGENIADRIIGDMNKKRVMNALVDRLQQNGLRAVTDHISAQNYDELDNLVETSTAPVIVLGAGDDHVFSLCVAKYHMRGNGVFTVLMSHNLTEGMRLTSPGYLDFFCVPAETLTEDTLQDLYQHQAVIMVSPHHVDAGAHKMSDKLSAADAIAKAIYDHAIYTLDLAADPAVTPVYKPNPASPGNYKL